AKPGRRKVAITHEESPSGERRRVLIAGLGKRESFDAEAARVAAAVVAWRARELRPRPPSSALPDDGAETGIVEGTLLALYSFDRFKTSGQYEKPPTLDSLEIAGPGVAEDTAARARVTAEAVNRARELQNLPSN